MLGSLLADEPHLYRHKDMVGDYDYPDYPDYPDYTGTSGIFSHDYPDMQAKTHTLTRCPVGDGSGRS